MFPYLQLWWPRFDQPVYVDRLPVWDGTGSCDPETGEILPIWKQARDQVNGEAHVLWFGTQLDIARIIAPSEDADRAVRYLTKYLTKSIADANSDPEQADPAYVRQVDRLHAELRWLPYTPRCANWLRYGIQPHRPVPGLQPGHCDGPAHERDNLGHGGRRMLNIAAVVRQDPRRAQGRPGHRRNAMTKYRHLVERVDQCARPNANRSR